MFICPKCSSHNNEKDVRCGKCGASMLGITDSVNKENAFKLRDKKRLQGHMLTGAILCFSLPTLFGLPLSLMPLDIATNGIFAVIFGVPLGYLVSKFATTTLGGAAIGCGIGVAYCVCFTLFSGNPVTMSSVLMGIGTGMLPGAIMGLHVSMDR